MRPQITLNATQELAAVSSFIASLPQNMIPATVDPSLPIDPQLVLDFDTRGPHAEEELQAVMQDVWTRNPVMLYSKVRSSFRSFLPSIIRLRDDCAVDGTRACARGEKRPGVLACRGWRIGLDEREADLGAVYWGRCIRRSRGRSNRSSRTSISGPRQRSSKLIHDVSSFRSLSVCSCPALLTRVLLFYPAADELVLTQLLYRLTSASELPILLVGGRTIAEPKEIKWLASTGNLQNAITEAGAIVDGARKKKPKKL